MTEFIRAAGGLVFRSTGEGKLEVLVVHRPAYDDWSLPKGKADPGESSQETAIREVLEETGHHCRIVAPLGTTRHPIHRGTKEVTWFAMRSLPHSAGFTPNREIDAVRWMTPARARSLLDHVNERVLVGKADLSKLARTATIRLLRHAAAKSAGAASEDDRLRPLTGSGQRQAAALADRLADAGIEHILTGPSLRCVQTVEPLAGRTGVDIATSEALAEGSDTDAALGVLDSLVGHNAVFCTHGDVIPATIKGLVRNGLKLESPLYCSSASIWEVDIDDGRPLTARYMPPPEV